MSILYMVSIHGIDRHVLQSMLYMVFIHGIDRHVYTLYGIYTWNR